MYICSSEYSEGRIYVYGCIYEMFMCRCEDVANHHNIDSTIYTVSYIFCENNGSLLIIFDAFIQPPHIVGNEYNEYIR